MPSKVNRHEVGQEAASHCISIIRKHMPTNPGEKMLIESVVNDIRLAFALEGAVKPAPFTNGEIEAPEVWFW